MPLLIGLLSSGLVVVEKSIAALRHTLEQHSKKRPKSIDPFEILKNVCHRIDVNLHNQSNTLKKIYILDLEHFTETFYF